MGKTTTISYATHSWTGIRGCQHATLPDGTPHPGCDHCFAEAFANRNPAVLGKWGPDGTRVLAAPAYWRQPLAWDRAAAHDAERELRFVREKHRGDVHIDRPRVLWDLGDLFEATGSDHVFDHKGRSRVVIYGSQRPATPPVCPHVRHRARRRARTPHRDLDIDRPANASIGPFRGRTAPRHADSRLRPQACP